MSKWSDVDERRIWRSLVVQSHGPDGVDAFDYLRAGSRADDGRGA
ncbi:hypothetical protein [Halosimplex pelagicum]|nr:hypothetical protein [Halosimplex pelagicum]